MTFDPAMQKFGMLRVLVLLACDTDDPPAELRFALLKARAAVASHPQLADAVFLTEEIVNRARGLSV